MSFTTSRYVGRHRVPETRVTRTIAAAVGTATVTALGVPVATAAPVDVPGTPHTVEVDDRLLDAADAALSKVGAPYAYGASGPSSFDCSGLTSWAHAQAGKTIPRTSGEQAAGGTSVPLSALAPGDVVAFYSGNSHVGIYIGGGQVVHAPNAGQSVHVADMSTMPATTASRF